MYGDGIRDGFNETRSTSCNEDTEAQETSQTDQNGLLINVRKHTVAPNNSSFLLSKYAEILE